MSLVNRVPAPEVTRATKEKERKEKTEDKTECSLSDIPSSSEGELNSCERQPQSQHKKKGRKYEEV